MIATRTPERSSVANDPPSEVRGKKPMKRFLIAYTFRLDSASVGEWHRRVAEFISALESDPELKGRITYRCMKTKDGADYYHFAEAVDDEAIKALGQREFFKRYTEETKRVAGGVVAVSPLEVIAETARSA
jgi:hypothetical protein